MRQVTFKTNDIRWTRCAFWPFYLACVGDSYIVTWPSGFWINGAKCLLQKMFTERILKCHVMNDVTFYTMLLPRSKCKAVEGSWTCRLRTTYQDVVERHKEGDWDARWRSRRIQAPQSGARGCSLAAPPCQWPQDVINI